MVYAVSHIWNKFSDIFVNIISLTSQNSVKTEEIYKIVSWYYSQINAFHTFCIATVTLNSFPFVFLHGQ